MSTGGNRDVKMSVIESILQELQSGDNRENVGLLLDGINFIYNQGRSFREVKNSIISYSL